MSVHPHAHYEHLAKLFEYPRRDFPAWVQATYELLAGRYLMAAAHVVAFAQALPTNGEPLSPDALDEVQEVYTRSFDVQPITTLEVGYVMFADDYKRGEMLVNLGREMRELGIDGGHELADHLSNVLRLLARWQDRDLASEFVRMILHPALERMVGEFGELRSSGRDRLYQKHFKTLIVSSAERGSIYLEPLSAVLEVLKIDFELGDRIPDPGPNDFLRSLEQELLIETEEEAPLQGGRTS
jgi:nitrate reductase assembly molybdenum cofactor insertion protein NarJ